MNFTLQLISFVLGKLYELVNSCVYDSYPLLLFCCAMVGGFIHTILMKVCLLEVSRFLYSFFFFFFSSLLVQSNFINCLEEEKNDTFMVLDGSI